MVEQVKYPRGRVTGFEPSKPAGELVVFITCPIDTSVISCQKVVLFPEAELTKIQGDLMMNHFDFILAECEKHGWVLRGSEEKGYYVALFIDDGFTTHPPMEDNLQYNIVQLYGDIKTVGRDIFDEHWYEKARIKTVEDES